MARSIPAFVTPSVLSWVRDREGYSLEQAALHLDIPPSILDEWEVGKSRPTLSQLRAIARLYKRPISIFFLSGPPTGFDPQREFRRIPGLTPASETPELRAALRLAFYRRQVALDVYESMNEAAPVNDWSLQPSVDPEEASKKIRDILGVTWQHQIRWRTVYEALNGWRDAIERTGTLTLQVGGVEVREMRGTSIPEGPLPLILLNSKDAPLARVFSLIHEFTHILLANGGHTTSTIEGALAPEDQLLERISNRIAAAVLLPKREFTTILLNHSLVLNGNEDALIQLSKAIKVSPEAILRRLVTLKKVSGQLYRAKREVWQKTPVLTAKASGGPSIEVKVISNIGKRLTSLVVGAYRQNNLSSSELTDFLGTQLKYLPKIEKQLLSFT